MKRDELTAYLDDYMGTYTMQDYSDNGLQVEGAGEVHRLALAVDANQQTIDAAIAAGAQMLIVHHGLFWGKPLRLTGPHRRRVKALLSADCSLYAIHLPLDCHLEVGNNVQLARLLNLSVRGGFAETLGVPIGVVADARAGMSRDALASRLGEVLGVAPLLLPGGPPSVRRVAIISGGAAQDIALAAAEGCDTFITGETSHSHYYDAAEYGINVLFGGHYATETVGLKALAEHLERQFRLSWEFIDRPTGL